MSSVSSDLTGRARIRNAAMTLFGEQGTSHVSIRSVADAASVSPALVIHHFGNRDGLIAAVDDYLVNRVRDVFANIDLTAGSIEGFLELAEEPQALAYLARVIVDNSETSRALFDKLNDVSETFVRALIDAGAARPVDDPAGVAAWLLAADIGMLVLRHHLARSLSSDPFDKNGIERFATLEIDILSQPLLNPGDHQ